jgi:1-acyl-sn-glycerol-3-phosphate acyltransferase
MPRRFPENSIYNLVYTIGYPILRMFFGFRVTGAEKFPESGAVIVAVNHASNYDPVLVGLACPRQLAFLAKAELFRNPVLRMLFHRLGAIPLNRGAADSGALHAAVNVLNSGRPLLLFPEGHRSKTGELQEGRRGVGMLSIRSGAPILPVYLSGSFHMFRNIFRRRVSIHFGIPIDAGRHRSSRISVKELYRLIGEDTMERIKELKHAHHG